MTTPLRFERIEVRSLDGFGRGGLRLDNLSEGINVVIGPNASGKTRTTSVIQWLLWPVKAPKLRTALAGKFHFGGHEWDLDLDHGDAQYTRDQTPADAPTLPPAEVAERYTLGLHEMLRSDSQPLAETIIRESAGGYDPGAAASVLHFRKAASSPKKEPGEVKERRKEYEIARDSQEAIQNDEAKVDGLLGELESAKRAASRVQVLQLAAESAIQHDKATRAQARFDKFPPALSSIAGDEVGRLDELTRKLADVREKLSAAEDDRAEAVVARDGCKLPEEGLPADLVGTLRGDLDALRDADGAVQAREVALAEAEASLASCVAMLGGAVTDEQLRKVDARRVVDLAEFASRYERACADQLTLAAEQDLLRGADGEAGCAVDAVGLQHAQMLLNSWLRSGEGHRSGPGIVTRLVLGVTVLIIVALAIALGWATVWPAAAVMVLAIIPLVLALWPSSSSGGERPRIEKDYRNLSADQPRRWTEADVSALVEVLQRSVAAAMVDQEKQQRLAMHEGRGREIRLRLDALETQRAELASQFGVAVDAAVARDGRTLAWLIRHLLDWQQAAGKVAGAMAGLEQAKAARQRVLARVDGYLSVHGYDPITTGAEARARVEDLARRGGEHDKATSRVKTEAQVIKRLQEGSSEKESEIESLYTRLELEPGDVAGLTRLCEEHTGYTVARSERDKQLVLARSADERLRSHPRFDEELLSVPLEELEGRKVRAEDEAGSMDELKERITGIRTRVEEAKKTHDVARTLAGLRSSEDALGERRERDHRAVAGHVVSSWLADETRDSTRPPVFRRAGELFTMITKHRYKLEISEGASPSFRAYDVNQERGFELEQLSSGTRIQLLLAVRMAFVEMSEEGVKLPLILDETLAISDDARAMAIVDAVLQLCADGRQVFYFTAQQDEVGKWARALKGREVPRQFLDLAEGRALADVEVFGEIVEEVEGEQVPPPGEMAYEEYGRLLIVPGIDLYEPLGEVHVWHLLDDAGLLHRLLSRGIERKGQLELLLDRGGGPLAGMGDVEEKQVRVAIRALAKIEELWSIGRGKRVDRSALLETGAVGQTFLDQVARIAEEQGGDGTRFMEALKDAEIKGFGPKKVETCQERLVDGGYLELDARVDDEQIRIEVVGALSDAIVHRELDEKLIARLLENVVGRKESHGPSSR